jgi:hypothetical protein
MQVANVLADYILKLKDAPPLWGIDRLLGRRMIGLRWCLCFLDVLDG